MVEFLTMSPTSGDGNYIKTPWEREPSFAYNRQIAQTAEQTGFTSLLLPVGTQCLDASIVAASLIQSTEKLNYLYAARPGFISPTVFAKQFSTLDYLSGGRAVINVVTGGSPEELEKDGDSLPHHLRYKRTEEFIHILKRLFSEEVVNHTGDFYSFKNASLFPKPVQQPRPQIYMGGASEAGKKVAAKLADVYMLWGESLENTKVRIEEMKKLADIEGRSLRYSVSLQVILGDTEELAWKRAHDLISHVKPEDIEGKEKGNVRDESIGHKRLNKLMEGSRDNNFVIGPNLWAGLTQVLSGNSIALVGTPDQVADRVVEYVELGFEKVLLRGYPHLEVIESIGKEVIPRVKKKLNKRSLKLHA
ncbi:LLM class flavin-dependent oxidoreductase [Domibacillus sp. DTU_2020_1001157_1_SI_ALB_TIR_016]|uniref:LLM class flavin-dependent oxidoreductase n=1 Tax=Domibacillus sp. DTU_2020_1001157_1_SI_ALB_TIR_016 TaxID=3077789 RepID=UPI0028E9CAE8|nr:LLM class flavin-dependent oxidoreductase [Domibacillus sp. DTU_2020_1001157_1_SI_ALB_TIR_016]WNS78356.1 LLM class flavin-dependent oxidoreductase [Domibacillus sp. DTU_2020_1001157_1_SI_ALB_TIR_016]